MKRKVNEVTACRLLARIAIVNAFLENDEEFFDLSNPNLHLLCGLANIDPEDCVYQYSHNSVSHLLEE